MAVTATLSVNVKRAWWLKLLDRPVRDTQVLLVRLGLLSPATAMDFYRRFSTRGVQYRINGGRWRQLGG